MSRRRIPSVADVVAAVQDRAGARGGDVRAAFGPPSTVVIALPSAVGTEVRQVLTV